MEEITVKPNSVWEKSEKASWKEDNQDKHRRSQQKAKEEGIEDYAKNRKQHSTAQPRIKEVQGNKIIGKGDGNKGQKKARSYQRLMSLHHKGT